MSLGDIEIDRHDLAFSPPPPRIIAVDLPRPPSTNRLWAPRGGDEGRGMRLSPEYKAWKKQADLAVMVAGTLRGFKMIAGPFEVRIIIARDAKGDLDNRIKSLLDWAQSRRIINNDKYCERILAEWGDAPMGCRLVLKELSQ